MGSPSFVVYEIYSLHDFVDCCEARIGSITLNNHTNDAINEDRGIPGTRVGHASDTNTEYNETSDALHLGTSSGRGRICMANRTCNNCAYVNSTYYHVKYTHDAVGTHIPGL